MEIACKLCFSPLSGRLRRLSNPRRIAPGAPQATPLSQSAFNQQLIGGSWSSFGPNIVWLEWQNGAQREPVPYVQNGSLGWTQAMQDARYRNYAFYVRDYVSGRSFRTGPPPANIGSTAKAIEPVSAIGAQDAFNLLVDLVGNSLALEQLGILPWSLAYATFDSLLDLWDATRLFSSGGSSPQ